MDINQSESGKRWVLICGICSKYTDTSLPESSLMKQSSGVLTEIIWLCKLAMKIQSWEQVIKIIACSYFNINSLCSHSYHCLPSCDDCGPTKWGKGADWKSTVPESPGKRQVTIGWAPTFACIAEVRGTWSIPWMRCWGVWCKSAFPVYPPSP